MKPSLVGRLMLAYTVVLAAVLASAWWSDRSFSEVNAAAQRLSQRSVEGIELTAELEKLLQDKSRLDDYLLSGDGSALATIRPRRQSFQAWLGRMEEFARTDDERRLLDRIRLGHAAYADGAEDVLRLQGEGRIDEARRTFVALGGDVERLLADSQRLLQLTEADMQQRRARAEASLGQARAIVLCATVLGAFCSLVLGFILTRHAARPIYQLVLRLGSSGIVDRVEVDSDEIGTLEHHVGALLNRVRQQQHRLEQAEKLSELGEIASEIAHETLNPVAGVKAMLQALRRAPLPPVRLAAELAALERELDRIEGIVRRLVRYARPLEPHMRRVSVAALLKRAAESAGRVPAAREHSIRVEPPVEDLEWVMDPDLVEQVLINLLVNGCEASPPGSKVELRGGVEDGQLCLSVRDQGLGLSGIDRERLFHPFFTTKPKGNGLGLAISRNIVREHGGQIEALAEDHGGSLFRLSLPEREPCADPS